MLHNVARAWDQVWWAFLHITGSDNTSGVEYGFWSGFGSDIQEAAILGLAWTGYMHLTCHVSTCKRPGFHHTAAGERTCKKHHPDGGRTVEQIHAAHHEASHGN